MSLTSRERVLLTLHHQEADRVPLDMMGNATMLLDRTYLRLRDHLGLAPIPPIRSGSSANYYDERILELLQIDFRRLFLPRNPVVQTIRHEDGSFTDPWGVRYKEEGPFVNVLESPLRRATTVGEVEAFPWPRAEELFTAAGLAEEARRKHQETSYALVARNPLTAGFLDRAAQLMGLAEFLTIVALAPEVAECLIAHLLEIYKGVYNLFLGAVGPYVQMVEVADDLGTQQSLLLSPAAYRRLLKPAEGALYALIRAKAPGAALFRHCDGAIFPLIPDLIDVGVEVLNPVQTSAQGMDPRRLKEAYGQQLTFHGGIEGMEGSLADLLVEVRERLDVLAPGGGYILASCNHMIGVPAENILALFAAAREYSLERRRSTSARTCSARSPATTRDGSPTVTTGA